MTDASVKMENGFTGKRELPLNFTVVLLIFFTATNDLVTSNFTQSVTQSVSRAPTPTAILAVSSYSPTSTVNDVYTIIITSTVSSITYSTSTVSRISTASSNAYASSISFTFSTSTVSASPGGSSDSSSGAIVAIVGAVIPTIIIIAIIIIIVIILLCQYRKRHKQQGSPSVFTEDFPPYVTISDKAEPISTTKKEIAVYETISDKVVATKLNSLPITTSEDVQKAEDNPYYEAIMKQVVSLKPDSLPLISTSEDEVKTSVGQPTTLHVTVGGDPTPEINWTKNGDPVDHLVLQDSSLYISPTTEDDQGRYTVTATNSEAKSSKTIQLTVLNPRFTQSNDNKILSIKVEDFTEHLAMLQANMCEQFQTEYDLLAPDTTEYTFHAAKLAVNVNKNRYKNIIPYDHSRVVLKLKDNCLGSDYINASFIDGYNRRNAYIACQSPMEPTVVDFWRMVWEYCVNTIVMITNLSEERKPKFHQYWPDNMNESITYGNISVTLLQENDLSDYTIKKFVLKLIDSENVEFEVQHFHFMVWPDHGVPKYATSLLSFHKSLHIHHKPKFESPLVVHCSAGVGQTGAFIAIDIELQRIKQEGVVDIHNTICKMRHNRMSTVQTLAQYMFVYDAIMESIKYGNNCITGPASLAKEKLEKLAKVNPVTEMSGYKSQFKNLEEVSPQVDDFLYDVACTDENWFKNRSLKHLPPDSSRVHLTPDSFHSDYVCANYINGYHQDKAFLATENPMDSTMIEFWAMVWEKNSHAIVMLSLLKENEVDVSVKYWPDKGEKMEVGQLIIKTTSEAQHTHITRRILKVKMATADEKMNTRTIHQFQYLCWPDHSCPSEASSIIDMVELVKDVQRQTNNGPITVHCSDGVGRTGTFCALMLCHERLLAEHMADVFDTIKTIRTQRPGMVENSKQYEFIHKSLVETMDRLARYSNF